MAQYGYNIGGGFGPLDGFPENGTAGTTTTGGFFSGLNLNSILNTANNLLKTLFPTGVNNSGNPYGNGYYQQPYYGNTSGSSGGNNNLLLILGGIALLYFISKSGK